MSQCFPTPLSDYKNIKVKIDLTNNATKISTILLM